MGYSAFDRLPQHWNQHIFRVCAVEIMHHPADRMSGITKVSVYVEAVQAVTGIADIFPVGKDLIQTVINWQPHTKGVKITDGGGLSSNRTKFFAGGFVRSGENAEKGERFGIHRKIGCKGVKSHGFPVRASRAHRIIGLIDLFRYAG